MTTGPETPPGSDAGAGGSPVSGRPPPRGAGPLRNVFSNWGAFLFYAVSGFFVSPFVVNTLGNEIYGTWALLASLVGYLGLLDLGVRGAVTRFVSNLHAAGKHDEAERFASAGLVVFSVTSVVAILAGLAVTLFIGRFSIPDELLLPARIAVILSSLTIATTLINGVYGGIITAMQRFDVGSGTDVVVEALRIVGLVIALRAGHGLVALAALQLGAGTLRLGVSVFWSRRLYPELRPSLLDGFRWKKVREIFNFSLTTSGLHGAAVIIFQIDAIVIGWFLPVAQVTFYAIAGNLSTYARATVSAISSTVAPKVSALQGAGALDDVNRVPLVGARLATLVLLPIVITFMVRGESFIGLWMGPEYAAPSGRVLLILSISMVPLAARTVMTSAVIGMNRHRVLLAPYATEALMNLGLSIYLVRSMGIEGVAWGTTIPGILIPCLVLPVIYSEIVGTSLARFWFEVWVRPSVSMLPFLACSWWVQENVSTASLAVFFAQVALILPAAFIGAWLWGIDEDEREFARVRMRRGRR